jgi:tetratricopeptide (TPR) repeat protein/predicted Ser/Thr protein kinase
MSKDRVSTTASPETEGARAEVTSEVDETRPVGSEARADELETDRKGRQVAVGDKLGRYVILRPLASGGMAHVHVAYDPELNREVALKVMRPGGPEGRDVAGERLLREAQAMAQLQHANVARVYDVGIVEGRVYMAMELVRGDNLEEWLERRKPTWREIVAVLVRAGRGLAAAHAAGLVHLDFKPRNVMVGDDGEIRVVDFGLARSPRSIDGPAPVRLDLERSHDSQRTGRLTEQVTEYGLVMGTPGYMAPEQLTGGLADARTDQFAFCVTMWTALYGRRPFRAKDGAQLNTAVHDGLFEPPPPGSHVPAWIRRLLEKGLSRRPADRHASMQDLLDALAKDPAIRRQRIALGVLFGGVVGVAVWGYTRPAAESGPSCDRAVEQMDGVWDDARRADVARAFARDERSFVADTMEKVTARLDAYARAWVEMSDDSCRATHKRGEQSADMLDRRTQCLMERRAELSALTDLFAAADPTVIEGAARAVASLPEIDDCADVARLARTDALPEGAELRAEIEHARDLVRRARVLSNTGKYTIGLLASTSALVAAEATGHLPTIAEARLSYGTLLGEYGDSETARAMILDGLYAAEAGQSDTVRANALIDLVFVSGMLEGRYEESRIWGRMAQAVLARLDEPEMMQVRLYSNQAAIAGTIGDAERSIDLYRKALAIYEESGEGIDENAASMYLGVGSAYFWRNRYEEARPYYELALRIDEELLGPAHPRTATAYENLGALAHAQGNDEEAYRQFMRAYEVSLGSETAPERLGTLYNGIGAALEGLERYEEAESWFRRAMQVIDDKGLQIPALGITLANLGGNLVQQGRAREAIPHFQRAIEVMRATFAKGSIYLSVMECQAGFAHLEVGEVDRALELITPAIDRYEGDDPEHDALYRGECRLSFAAALAKTPEASRPEAVKSAAKGRSASEWADLAERDLLTVEPRARPLLRRLASLRKRLRAG